MGKLFLTDNDKEKLRKTKKIGQEANEKLKELSKRIRIEMEQTIKLLRKIKEE
jgi:hypothetical protein